MILALYASADDPVSMYKVSLRSLVYFQRCAPDKLFIAKIKKGSNSINTVNRFRVIAFCNFSYGLLSVYQVSSNLEICSGQKCDGRTDERSDGQSGNFMLSL